MRRSRMRATVAMISLMTACSNGVPQIVGASPIAPSSPVDVARYGRLLAMSDERRIDTALLQQIFRGGSSAERAAAALAVGQVRGSTLAPTLRALLADRDTTVAGNAAYSLGQLADTASIAALTQALSAPASVAYNAAWALGQIGEPARATIVASLVPPSVTNIRGSREVSTNREVSTGGGLNLESRIRVALLLATFSLKPVPVEAVRPWLADREARVRWSAAYGIARAYAPAGVRDLIPLATDADGEVRAQVARAFSHRAAGDSLASLVRASLSKLVGDPNPHVRINALHSLATYGASSRAAIVAATHDPDANVRVTAAQELGAVLDNTRAAWMTAWKADSGFMYRRSLLASALSQDVVLPATEMDEPDSWTHQGDWRLRAAVAEAGGASTTILRLREVSLPASRDPDPRVRAVAYAAMAPHADTADEHPWRREFMEYGLTDADVIVRATAIGSLEGHATAAEVPLVLESYRRSEADTLNDARIAGVRFFISAWQRDSVHFADSTIKSLRSLPVPPDMLTRIAADSFALLASWRAAPRPAPKPASWYESIVRTRILPALGGKLPRAEIVTERGTITLELYPVVAPLTVENFLSLAASNFYDDGRFFRVVPNFVAQDGDHRGDGAGGPAYNIRDEFNPHRYERGSLGMALSGPDTGGSQYFMTVAPDPHLDGRYTVFGRVVSGFEALDALVQGDHLERIRGL